MRIKMPGSRVHIRLFERVATTNDTYDIFDVGVDFADGDNIQKIDSIAIGGSFASAKEAIRNYEAKQTAKQAEEELKSESSETSVATAAA